MKLRKKLAFGLTLIGISISQSAKGEMYQLRSFVTEAKYSANLGGLAGADEKCQVAANAALLGGNWKAVVSSATISAKDRISQTLPVVNLFGGKIWDAGQMFSSGQFGTISLSENKYPFPHSGSQFEPVFTNTLSNGSSAGADCAGWTSTSGQTVGENVGGGTWLAMNTKACSLAAHLYCIEQKASLERATFETVGSTAFYDAQQSTGHSGYLSLYGKRVTLSGSDVEEGTFDHVVFKVNFPSAKRETNVFTDSAVGRAGDILFGNSMASCHLIAKNKHLYNLPAEFKMSNFGDYKVSSATWNPARTLYTVVLEPKFGAGNFSAECHGPAN